MLGKLFKHDFNALSRTLFPTQLGVLAGGLVITLLLRLTLALSAANATHMNGAIVVNGVVMGVSVSAVVLIGLAIMASMLLTLLFVCLHFYHNMMGDEGYLTFTLPTTAGKLIWSKVLAGLVWMAVNLAAIVISVAIIAVFGTASRGFMNMDALSVVDRLFEMMGKLSREGVAVGLLIPEAVIWIATMAAAQLMELYFAITVGGQIAKKNKLLAAIGMYLLINLVVGVVKRIFTFGSFGLGALQSATMNGPAAFCALAATYLGVSIGISLALFIGFFFWSRYLLSHDLNLQ